MHPAKGGSERDHVKARELFQEQAALKAGVYGLDQRFSSEKPFVGVFTKLEDVRIHVRLPAWIRELVNNLGSGAGEEGLYPELVKPEKKEPEPPGPEPKPELKWYRIIAEDLNAHDLDKDGEVDDTDFDFNDIVLDVALTDKGADCKLQAAGATLKIRINGNDNLEVHKLFGVDQNQMVNTHAGKASLPGPDGLGPIEFSIDGSFSSVDDIKIEVYRQNRWMTLHAPKGDAASKIVVPITFEWPDERQSLKAKYPDFLKYVQNPDAYREWWNNVVK